MNTLYAPAPPNGPEAVDRLVGLLLDLWDETGEVDLVEFWRVHGSPWDAAGEDQLECLGALIKADLRSRIERGMPVEIEDYLDRFPCLVPGDSRVLSLIYEEYCAREEHGQSPNAEEFYTRYAPWKRSLVWQFQLHQLFNPADGQKAAFVPRYPEVGDHFEEYHLTSLIGKGGSSRVFLANDLSLGGKRVVLKVSLDQGQEPKTQGVLDHPHIVPVNSVAFQPDEELRGLSMPFRPGMPLDEIIKQAAPATRPRHAMTLWNVLFVGESPSISALGEERLESIKAKGPSGDGWSGFPRSGSYAEGVGWIVMILARTLQYAHEMRTFHRDVKPGNVLLTLQHGPQLLDFNLADSPYAVQHAKSAVLGGTLPYMAPEQIEAFLDPEQWDKVGACSDIYSLGLVLRELLTGEPPDLPNERLPLPAAMRELLDRRRRLPTDVRKSAPQTPFALEAIVKRCLRFHPGDRYPSAAALAEDLERFLVRRPLLVAANPSRRERLGNWFYRNRRKLALHSAYLLVIAYLAFRLIPPPSKTPIENRPEFLTAVHAIDEGRHRAAMDPLRKLLDEYPRSPLPLAYLAICQRNSLGLVPNDAQVSMKQALAEQASREVLEKWARSHPSLSAHLIAFARAQLEHIGEYNNKTSGMHDSLDKERDAQDQIVKQDYLDTNYKSLLVAVRAGFDSEELESELAAAEDNLGLYQSAHDRITRLIDKSISRQGDADRSALIDLVNRRARITVRWVGDLRKQGRAADGARELELLREARDDLDRHSGHVTEMARKVGISTPNQVRVYSFLWYSTEVWLALGEIEHQRQDENEAQDHFKKAKEAFDRLDVFGRAHFPDQPRRLASLRERVLLGLGVKPVGF